VEHEKKHTSDKVLGFLPSLGVGIGGGDLSTVDLPEEESSVLHNAFSRSGGTSRT
jgi:hypothetical protein